tara:strand:- start:4063 stop:4638 length:576 start_codon:yes stop_codon:yes gene_type:complete
MTDENKLDVQKQTTQEYYGTYPGFRIASGIKVPDGDLQGQYVDLELITNNLQGIAWYKHGLQKLVVNGTSYETVGIDAKKGDVTKIISAANGDIKIEALDGDIFLEARNIRLKAADELTLTSGQHILLDGAVMNLKATTTNILGKKNLSMGGQFIEVSGGVSVEEGTQTDKKQGGFLGSLISTFDKFKDFL